MRSTCSIGVAALVALPGCLLNWGLDSLPDGYDVAPTCSAPLMTCGTSCVDTQSSAANCGSCDNACATDSFGCNAGVCATLLTLVWTAASTANPVTVTATPGTGTPEVETFDYMAAGTQVYTMQTFTFSAMAPSTLAFDYTWQYTGFHAYFMASAGLQAFADGPSGRITTDLVPAATTTSSNFTYNGTSVLNVNAGYAFGFIASGVNFDMDSRLLGTVTITAN